MFLPKVKAYKDEPIALGTIMFTIADNSLETYWAAHEIYHRHSGAFSDDGAWGMSL